MTGGRVSRPLKTVLYLNRMATSVAIGSLISRRPAMRGGRPCVAGTGVSVRRIAVLHNMGTTPADIVRKYGHLSLAQVHAALTYYYAAQAEVDDDLAAEDRLAEELEKEYARNPKCA
jgi:uncharacterized protein (DUF433 family)